MPLSDYDAYVRFLIRRLPVSVFCNRVTNFAIHNFSDCKLSFQEKLFLGQGLDFIPPPKLPDPSYLFEELGQLQRRMALSVQFPDDKGKRQFKNPKP